MKRTLDMARHSFARRTLNWLAKWAGEGRSLLASQRAVDELRIAVDGELKPAVEGLRLNVKQLGYELGRRWTAEQPAERPDKPEPIPIGWRASTQADLETEWFRYWCAELRLAPVPHRKLWEYAWVLQNLHAYDMLKMDRAGLGFGCGEEPLPSYLAAQAVDVTATDLAPDAAIGRGWVETGQHTGSIDHAFHSELVDRKTFDRKVRLEYVDMNCIPAKLHSKFDFCWSICSLEHLGNIENGLRFVRESMKCLIPGGLAIHTTEYNVASDDETLTEGDTVLFRRRDFARLAAELRGEGYLVPDINFGVGEMLLDKYIDLPPYQTVKVGSAALYGGPLHLKQMLSRWPTTCFGIIAQRPVSSP